MKILLFSGTGTVSRLIRWQTRGEFNHVAVMLNDGSIVEAWEGNIFRLLGSLLLPRWIKHEGVRQVESLDALMEMHSSGTSIHLYAIDAEYNAAAVTDFLLRRLGAPYDLMAVLKFVSRRPAKDNAKWFCSELCHRAFHAGGLDLVKGQPWMVSPRDISMSPYLRLTDVKVLP